MNKYQGDDRNSIFKSYSANNVGTKRKTKCKSLGGVFTSREYWQISSVADSLRLFLDHLQKVAPISTFQGWKFCIGLISTRYFCVPCRPRRGVAGKQTLRPEWASKTAPKCPVKLWPTSSQISKNASQISKVAKKKEKKMYRVEMLNKLYIVFQDEFFSWKYSWEISSAEWKKAVTVEIHKAGCNSAAFKRLYMNVYMNAVAYSSSIQSSYCPPRPDPARPRSHLRIEPLYCVRS